MIAKKKSLGAKKKARSTRSSPGTGKKSRTGVTRANSSRRTKAPSGNARKVNSRKASGKTAARPASSPARRKNPRLIQNLLLLSMPEQEEHFERIQEADLIKLFDSSYPSDLVNLLLSLKKSTCRRLFEIVVKHRKKAYLDVITLYYYKDYLINPFPLEIESVGGGAVPNYYAIVGMARDASEYEIEMASKLLIRAYHPDSFPPADRKLGERHQVEIKGAFDRLKSPKRREEVNRELPSINYLYPKRNQSWLDLVQRLSV